MQAKKLFFPTLYFTMFAFVVVFLFCLSGCNSNTSNFTESNDAAENNISPISDTVSERNLRLAATPTDRTWSRFSCTDLNGNFSEGVVYYNVSNVTIEICGENLKLEDALRDGLISDAEIFFYARQDAAEGYCQEVCESVYGLTNFTYFYPELDLRIIYDVLECPDGQQRLISDMTIYPPGTDMAAYYNFLDEENGFYIVEDWGVSFEVEDVSPTGIRLLCTHSEGQQIGQIYLLNYLLSNENDTLSRVDGSNVRQDFEAIALTMNGTTEITIDWSEYYGDLPSGDYQLLLDLEDVYDESNIHPLMTNYYDLMNFLVEFSIP